MLSGRSLLCTMIFTAALLLCVTRSEGQTFDYRERVNLGSMINTEFDEVYPIISPDGKRLFFVRKEYPGNVGGPKADIWCGELLFDSSWGIATNAGPPLNNAGYNYVCAVLPDNNSLLLGNQYLPDGTQRQGIAMSHRLASGWSWPVNQTIRQFRNESRYAEFTISPDGSVLIMSIQNDQSAGERDMYLSMRVDDSTWTAPVNPGTPLNSAQEDITPFLAADGKTLYFSSARPGGFGSNDIYMSRRLDDTWLAWSEPQNLGYPINTPAWDAYYSVPASGAFAYFVSTVNTFGLSDIFRVPLQKEDKPTPVLLLTGITKDFANAPLPARIYYQKLSDTLRQGEARANPETGAFTIALPAGEQWQFRAELDGYYPISENIDLRKLDSYLEQSRDLVLVPIARGSTILLNNIFFDFDKASLTSESIPELQRLVSFLNSQGDVRIQISGHTDSVGTVEYNISLSQARAQAVVDYLISHGISSSRLTAVGYGKGIPVESNETEEGRGKNRRVEFTIL